MNPMIGAAALMESVLLGPWVWARGLRGVPVSKAITVPLVLTALAIIGAGISGSPHLPALGAFVLYGGLVAWRVLAIRPLSIDSRFWSVAWRLGLRRPPLIIPSRITL